jgi:hypothetical protein
VKKDELLVLRDSAIRVHSKMAKHDSKVTVSDVAENPLETENFKTF